MKLFRYIICICAFAPALFSCSEESLKLYHTPEEVPAVETVWLLETVDYPEFNPSVSNPGFTVRTNQHFTYSGSNSLSHIRSNANSADSLIKKDYLSVNKIAFSKYDKRFMSGGSMVPYYEYYDSLFVVLDGQNRAKYAIHTTHQANPLTAGVKNRTQNDSTAFFYDAEGYLSGLERYPVTGNNTMSFSEKYTVENGNITKVEYIAPTKRYIYTYTHDNMEYAAPAKYCYEMPLNTRAIGTGCFLIKNYPFMSEYFGKDSKNNVVRTRIEYGSALTGSATAIPVALYADITYQYTFDENNLLRTVKMSGATNNMATNFSDLTISFGYKGNAVK